MGETPGFFSHRGFLNRLILKYRYRQVPKKSFKDAKKITFETLDACPVDVIRHFINKAWRFMSAYHIGLTGQAAAWAVRKQKGHRAVSKSAMMHLDMIINKKQLNSSYKIWILRSKNLAALNTCGKNFGCAFLDIFRQSEFRSGLRFCP
ncbi:hypothetical protein K439DRAFT_1505968 [Ramaria rubella]|nr:hypothetical protein K439DRAFT_1505968 [Ramaria rubella]